jgi:hypothetical protein
MRRIGKIGNLPQKCQKCGKDCRIVDGSQALDISCNKVVFESGE